MKENLWRYGVSSTVLLLTPLVFSFAIALDIYIPAVPEIMRVLRTTQAGVQLTLSLFVIAMGIGQLLFGPLSDQYGRKKLALASAAIFIWGSLLCAVADSIQFLILARVIQALGACGTFVISFAVVRDVFKAEQRGKIYSYINGAIALSPLFAPAIGAMLDLAWGWRSIFISLIGFGVLGFLVIVYFFQETLPKEQRVKFDMGIFKRYLSVIAHREASMYIFACCISVAVLFSYFSLSPYILMNLLHVPESRFGFYFAVMGLCLLLGTLFCGLLTSRVSTLKIVAIGGCAILLGGLMMAIWELIFGLSVAGFLLPVAIMSVGSGIAIGSGATGALGPFAAYAGTASAVMGAAEFIFASLVGEFNLLWPVHSDLLFSATIILLSMVLVIWVLINNRKMIF